jgi:hypothetical protein
MPDLELYCTVPAETSSAVFDELSRILRLGGEASAREIVAMAASHVFDRVSRIGRGLSASGFDRVVSMTMELLALRCGVPPVPIHGDLIDPRSAFWSSLTPGELEALGDSLMTNPAPYIAAIRVISRETPDLDVESTRYLEATVGSVDQSHSSLARKILIAAFGLYETTDPRSETSRSPHPDPPDLI